MLKDFGLWLFFFHLKKIFSSVELVCLKKKFCFSSMIWYAYKNRLVYALKEFFKLHVYIFKRNFAQLYLAATCFGAYFRSLHLITGDYYDQFTNLLRKFTRFANIGKISKFFKGTKKHNSLHLTNIYQAKHMFTQHNISNTIHDFCTT